MALRKFKPVTAGTRWRIGNAYAEITTDNPEKSLLEKVKTTAGRNSQGRRAMRYMGGGHKKMYRLVDFKRDKKSIPAVVASFQRRRKKIYPGATGPAGWNICPFRRFGCSGSRERFAAEEYSAGYQCA